VLDHLSLSRIVPVPPNSRSAAFPPISSHSFTHIDMASAAYAAIKLFTGASEPVSACEALC
jgi:hypothetical protein